MSSHPETWPLVGRDTDLERCRDLLRAPGVTGLVLAGVGGVGKSRLARECLDLAARNGHRTARTLATRSASDIPLGALTTVVTVTSDGPPAMQQARDGLLALASDGPLALLVDDAHLLDDVSAAVLLSVASEPNLFPIVTVRTGEPVPDAITALWKDEGAERVDVDPLGAAGLRELLERVLDGPVDPATVTRLADASAGRPLALRELVDGALSTGQLDVVADLWTLAGDIRVPHRLSELIGEALDRFGEQAGELIATLALTEPLPLAVVTRLGLLDEVDALDGRGVVRVTDESGTHWAQTVVTGGVEPDVDLAVRLDNPLYGEVALDRTGELRRRAILSACAAALDTPEVSDADRLRVLLWRHWAGEEVAAGQLLAAAHRCYLVGDYRRCGDLAEPAWQAEPSFAAGHLLGFAWGRDGRAREADHVLAATEALAADDRERVLVTMARTENVLRGLGDPDRADELCRDAEAQVTDPAWRAELVAHRAMSVVQRGAVDEALDLVAPILATPDQAPRAYVKAAYAAGIALTHAGRTDDATATANEALPRHEALWTEDLFQTEPGVHHVTNLFALIGSGRLDQASALLAVGRDITRSALPRYGHGWILYLSGLAEVTAGRVVDALAHFTDATPIFVAGSQRVAAQWCLAGAATAAALQGDVARARRLLGEADVQAIPGLDLGRAMVDEADGWCAAAIGDRATARRAFADGAERALALGDVLGGARLLHARARCGEPQDALVDLEPLVASAQGELIELMTRQVQGLAGASSPAALDVLGRDLEERGLVLWAAETAAEAARSHRRAGDARTAARAAQRATELLARCQGARTNLALVTDAPEPLTARERDIALLGAERLSSKEIAERLNLSRRTVDNYLRRIYQKLGVTRRADLADALSPPP